MNIFSHKQDTYLDKDNAKIYYETLGDPKLPALLLLHGGVGNIEEFNKLIPSLVQSHFIIGIDSRGHGRSTLGTPDLSYQLLQEDAEYILTRLGINKLSVIGFSDGGIIGYRLALGNKVKVTHLVAIAAGWHHETNPETIAMLKHITGPWWKKRHPEYFKKYHRLNPNGDFDLLVDKCVSMWLDQTASGYPDERIREIKCKLLLIRGDADFLIPLKSLTDIKSFLPQTQFLNIPYATHAVLEEKPEVCLKYIEQFLAAK